MMGFGEIRAWKNVYGAHLTRGRDVVWQHRTSRDRQSLRKIREIEFNDVEQL